MYLLSFFQWEILKHWNRRWSNQMFISISFFYPKNISNNVGCKNTPVPYMCGSKAISVWKFHIFLVFRHTISLWGEPKPTHTHIFSWVPDSERKYVAIIFRILFDRHISRSLAFFLSFCVYQSLFVSFFFFF